MGGICNSLGQLCLVQRVMAGGRMYRTCHVLITCVLHSVHSLLDIPGRWRSVDGVLGLFNDSLLRYRHRYHDYSLLQVIK